MIFVETTIYILNVMDYEKDGQDKSVLNFIFYDEEKFQNTDRYLGFTSCTLFYNKHIRDLFNHNMIAQPIKAKIVSKPSLSNPMKSYNTIESVVINGKTINLL